MVSRGLWVVSGWCFGGVSVVYSMSRWCFDGVSGVSQWFLGVSVVSWWCLGGLSVVFRRFVFGLFLISCWSFAGLSPVFRWYFSGILLYSCWSLVVFLLDSGWSGWILLVSRSCRARLSPVSRCSLGCVLQAPCRVLLWYIAFIDMKIKYETLLLGL